MNFSDNYLSIVQLRRICLILSNCFTGVNFSAKAVRVDLPRAEQLVRDALVLILGSERAVFTLAKEQHACGSALLKEVWEQDPHSS